MTLKTLDDPVPWLLLHPERCFRTGKINEVDLANGVWLDALLSGSRDVIVRHSDDTWVIASSMDWLRESALSAPDLFTRIIPLTSGGPNSMRSEIILNAFCAEVIAVVAGVVVFDKAGTGVRKVLEDVLSQWPECVAGVAFRL